MEVSSVYLMSFGLCTIYDIYKLPISLSQDKSYVRLEILSQFTAEQVVKTRFESKCV